MNYTDIQIQICIDLQSAVIVVAKSWFSSSTEGVRNRKNNELIPFFKVFIFRLFFSFIYFSNFFIFDPEKTFIWILTLSHIQQFILLLLLQRLQWFPCLS